MDQAREALWLAEAKPDAAASLAALTVQQARLAGDLPALSLAEQALGLAARQVDDPDRAEEHLRAALRWARRAGSAELAAQARMRLAFQLNVRGRARQALREIDAAITELTGAARAQAQAQRAVILIQQGRLDEAFADSQDALAILRRAGDLVWVQRALYNRAVLYGYRQQFTAAEADLREAEQLCVKLGLDLSLGYVHQNLGWISGLRGHVPAALRYLDLAEACLRRHHAPLGELLADRAQLLLSARLIVETREAAEQAVQELGRQGRRINLSEARLLLAQAAILDGQPLQARLQASRAGREFTHQQRPRWAILSSFIVLQARMALDSARAPATTARRLVGVGQLERCADDLASAGWLAPALEARLAAARLALGMGQLARAVSQLRQVADHRSRGPALLRARAWHGEALRRGATGDRRGAIAAARAALRILDEHRASLGATDLRAHAAAHRLETADFGLDLAFDSGQAGRVLDWAEQARAGHLMLRPVSPPSDPDLAATMTELRAITIEILTKRGEGANTRALQRRQQQLERLIRDRHRHRPGDAVVGRPRPFSVTTLAAALHDTVLVEFVQRSSMLHAVVVADRRARLVTLAEIAQAHDLISRAHFALHRLARAASGTTSHAAALALLQNAATRLDELLLTPLAIDDLARPLVVVPTAPLQALPWAILPSCANRAVTIAPSAALWVAGHTGRSSAAKTAGHTVVAAGPGLPGADSEAAAVAAIHHVRAVTGAAATVQHVTAALDGAKLAHLAAHGHIHPHNPLFSALQYADGPLTAYDLSYVHTPPQMVILAACDSGRSAVRVGDELLGLAAFLLALGTRQIVASVAPIPDAETAPLMTAMHRNLAAGHTASQALAAAQQHCPWDAPAAAAAAGFISIGTDMSLPSY